MIPTTTMEPTATTIQGTLGESAAAGASLDSTGLGGRGAETEAASASGCWLRTVVGGGKSSGTSNAQAGPPCPRKQRHSPPAAQSPRPPQSSSHARPGQMSLGGGQGPIFPWRSLG